MNFASNLGASGARTVTISSLRLAGIGMVAKGFLGIFIASGFLLAGRYSAVGAAAGGNPSIPSIGSPSVSAEVDSASEDSAPEGSTLGGSALESSTAIEPGNKGSTIGRSLIAEYSVFQGDATDDSNGEGGRKIGGCDGCGDS